MKHPFRSLQLLQATKIFWLIALVALVSILLLLPRSPLPWLDEIFYASASLSVVRGGTPVPTVMGAFPHTIRLDLLYGPMISFLGSLDIRLLGLSATGWRLLGFMGAVFAIFSAACLSRRLDRSPVAMAAAAMIVALSQGVGARATSGRLDTVTVALELFALTCTLGALRPNDSRPIAFVWAALAGTLCGLAALSTPRSFPFVLGLFVAVGLELALARKWELVAQSAIIAVTGLLPVWLWTFSQGMNPIGWFLFIAAASRGDKINVSPVLHGSWHLFSGPRVPLVSGLLFFLLMFLVFANAILTARSAIGTEHPDLDSGVRLASITVLVNYVALFTMIARFWDYEIFVVPLVTPVLTALTAKILRNGERRTLQRAVLCSWLMLAVVLVAIRSGKVIAWLASYDERDPQPLHLFITNNLPSNSRVFGPEEFYFYAVEAAGSHYLFVRHTMPAGLISKLDHDLNWQEQLKEGQPVYLIWPADESLPSGLAPANLSLEASFIAKLGKEPVGWRKAGWGSGYPSTNLYRIVSGQSDGNTFP
jgi:4-amino-4-deoxy-L-arabinose transferase-like glycosyltransferase